MYKTVINHYPSTRKHFYMPKQNKQQKTVHTLFLWGI